MFLLNQLMIHFFLFCLLQALLLDQIDVNVSHHLLYDMFFLHISFLLVFFLYQLTLFLLELLMFEFLTNTRLLCKNYLAYLLQDVLWVSLTFQSKIHLFPIQVQILHHIPLIQINLLFPLLLYLQDAYFLFLFQFLEV